MKKSHLLAACILMYMGMHAQSGNSLTGISIETNRKVLNPVLHPGETASFSVRGVFADGRRALLPASDIRYSSRSTLSSGDGPVLSLKGNHGMPGEGGVAIVTATVSRNGRIFHDSLDIVVRPYYRDYHQTLVLKLFLGMEGEPVARLADDPLFRKKHDVICTFAQALDVIRNTDRLTRGIPKIIYLVGWQKGGHDHLYPSWDTVNQKLKRAGDSTALQSLRWLIVAARRYNTTVSLHINMVDAYTHSPLWDEYLRKDVFARDKQGRLLVRDIGIKDDSMYIVSYTREWAEGLAQKRIDRLIAMVPELKEGHTIHIDAFIDKGEHEATLSPWHAMPQHGGIDIYKEAQTQHKIFKYWRARGFDVTGEGIFWAHPPGEGFYGLQPMSWWYPADINYQMQTPECLSARGRTDRSGYGDFRFGSSMHGEEIYQKDKDSLPGFLTEFCQTTLPWYYLSRLSRQALVKDTLFYSGGVRASREGTHRVIRKGHFILRDNDDLFVPALWKKKEIIAYSQSGYANRKWLLPEDWYSIHAVDISRITLNGLQSVAKNKVITDNQLDLSLDSGEAVCITPSEWADTVYAANFGIRPGTHEDMTAKVQKLVDQCRSKNNPMLIFQRGRYDFWPQHSIRKMYFESNTTNDSVKYCATLIKDMPALAIDGRGSSFIYHGRIQPFTIDTSNNISIKNISIDWDIPLTAQAEVTDTAADHIDLLIDRTAYPYEIQNGQLVFNGEGWSGKWSGAIAFDKSAHLIVPQTGDDILGGDWQKYRAVTLPDNAGVRLNYPFRLKPQPGNILVLRHNERDHAGIFITGSDDVHLENIQLFHSAGLGILSQYSGDLFFKNVQAVPNEKKKRYFSGHDDGMQFSNCRDSIIVDGCRFQGLMDDPINVHGTAVKIIRTGPGNTLLCRFMHSQSTGMQWAGPGDSVGFINHTSMQTIATGTVTRFERISETDFTLQFSQALPTSITEGDALENITWTPDLVIRHCTFGSNRARGILVSTPGKVIIENNSFASSGSAILIAGDANYWYESGAVKDVLIRHNEFLSPCLTSMYGGCEAIISIQPEIPQPGREPFHHHIRIEHNLFHPFDYPVLYAKSVGGISFDHNTISRSNAFRPYHHRKSMITLAACSQAVVQDNILQGNVLGKNIALQSPLDTPDKNSLQFPFTIEK